MTTGYDSLKVEFAFGYAPLDPLAVFTDVTSKLHSLQVNRGRSGALDTFPAGTCSIVLKNDDYRFDPDNASGPYFGNLLPLVQARVSVNDSTSTRRFLFTGHVVPRGGYDQNYMKPHSTTTVSCIDFLGVLSTAQLAGRSPYPPRANATLSDLIVLQAATSLPIEQTIPTYAGYDTGALLTAMIGTGLLSDAPFGWSQNGTAATITQGLTLGANMLQWVQDLALTEGGAVYVTGAGVVNFDMRYAVTTVSRISTSQATFDDSGSNVPFSVDGFTKTYASDIWNKATITPDGQLAQTYSDPTSILDYTESDYQGGGIYDGSAEAISRAQWIVKQYKDPVSCPASIGLFPRRSNTVLDAAVQRELRDRVTVKFRPPGAAAQVTATVFVEKITHAIDCSTKAWRTNLEFSSTNRFGFAAGITLFTLDSSALDGTDVLGF